MMEVLEEKEVDLDEGRETAALTAVAMFMNYEYRELRGEPADHGDFSITKKQEISTEEITQKCTVLELHSSSKGD